MGVEAQREADFWDSFAQRGEVLTHGEPGRVEPPLQPALMSAAERALDEAQLPKGSTVVDIATAAGTVAVTLARAGMKVLATDFSQAMVDHVASYGFAEITTRRMDGQAMEVPDASFDAAFSLLGVTLFEDWKTGLAEMRRIVRPGGVVSVGTWTSQGAGCAVRLLYVVCRELFPDLGPPDLPEGILKTQSEQDLLNVMSDAGFTDVRVVFETKPCEIGREELDEPDRLFMFSSQWAALTESQRTQVVSLIEQRFPADGPYLVDSVIGIATGYRS